jgi:GTPase SAR1 family protein
LSIMDPGTLQSSSLSLLQSTDELGLLDAIDELRSQGLSYYVALPQLIVCGDQSSGKSSVLEAISGIPFPTKDNLCTRFATELILRRTTIASAKIVIVPSQTRTEAEQQYLTGFEETLQSFEDFPDLLEKAQKFMGISSVTSAFSNDVLRIELSGPDRPHLTIVDLPGLIHSENKQQTAADIELVLSMVQMYRANRRSIILAVVSAKSNYANQIVTKLAKDVDFKGYRTLGIITKPDTLLISSESKAGYANLARNQDVEFRLGWHVLRNRDYVTRDTSTEDRDQIEELFFSQGIWKEFPKTMVGIASLRTRLSKVLLDQIRAELPSLSQEIDASLQETLQILERLGPSRGSLDEQRLFLLDISQSFQSITRAAVDSTYGDTFFGDARSAEGYNKRLQSVVQDLNLQFASTMRMKGHRRHILDHAPPEKMRSPPFQTQAVTPEVISRRAFLNMVAQLLKQSRGRELPGMFNPLIVGDLFREQSKPWESLASNHLEAVLEATRTFLELIISHRRGTTREHGRWISESRGAKEREVSTAYQQFSHKS